MNWSNHVTFSGVRSCNLVFLSYWNNVEKGRKSLFPGTKHHTLHCCKYASLFVVVAQLTALALGCCATTGLIQTKTKTLGSISNLPHLNRTLCLLPQNGDNSTFLKGLYQSDQSWPCSSHSPTIIIAGTNRRWEEAPEADAPSSLPSVWADWNQLIKHHSTGCPAQLRIKWLTVKMWKY